jgi:preprotein translocase subunit SecA
MSVFYEPKLSLSTPTWVGTQWRLLQNSQLHKHNVFKYHQEAELVISYYESLKLLSELEIKNQQITFASLARRGRLTQQRDNLLKALAWVTYTCSHSVKMTPYPIQLSCALAMIDGYLVQLAPGEGKTLTIAVVAVIFGWSQKPCHVITANDYLAKRDMESMKPIFLASQVSASFVEQEISSEEKQQRYQAHIVYGTAKQFLADYLSDIISFGGLASRVRMSLTQWQGREQSMLMRGLYSVIVDEADSILIDDATTPLIISTQEENPLLLEAVVIARDFIDTLIRDEDYLLSLDDWDVNFTVSGEQKITDITSQFPLLWHHRGRLEDLITQAILAKDKFNLDEHFVIVDGEVILVDEATGRMMHGRSWSYGLHQAVESRVGVEMTSPTKTLEKMSFQNFFQSYHHLTGASGTLQNIQAELFHTYQVKTLEMPTRLLSKLNVSSFSCYATQVEKTAALMSLIESIHKAGQPILIGTRRIKDTEQLSEHMLRSGFNFDILNAKLLEQEAEIVANAGQNGKITLSTNMAGRGTDISVSKTASDQGGLFVIMYEPHNSSRIDWQLFGRTGRQGNPGSAFPMVSLEDPLFMNLKWWQRLLLLAAKSYLHKNRVQNLVSYLVKKAQVNAQHKDFKQRKQLAKIGKLSQNRMSFVKNKTSLRDL